MRHLRSVLMAVALSAVAVMPVKADWGPPSYPYYVGGNSFATVASIQLEYNLVDFDTAYAITVHVINYGEFGEVFKAIGLINVPVGLTFDPTKSEAPAGWLTPANELGGAGLPEGQVAYKAPSPGPENGIKVGAAYGRTFVFYFAINGLTNVELVDDIGVGIHAISGPNGCSTKLGVIDGEVIDNVNLDSYASCGSTTVPEPSTVILLGTGLVGLLGVAYRRRRDED